MSKNLKLIRVSGGSQWTSQHEPRRANPSIYSQYHAYNGDEGDWPLANRPWANRSEFIISNADDRLV